MFGRLLPGNIHCTVLRYANRAIVMTGGATVGDDYRPQDRSVSRDQHIAVDEKYLSLIQLFRAFYFCRCGIVSMPRVTAHLSIVISFECGESFRPRSAEYGCSPALVLVLVPQYCCVPRVESIILGSHVNRCARFFPLLFILRAALSTA